MRIARESFKADRKPEDYQKFRFKVTSAELMAGAYDTFFGNDSVLIKWPKEGTPSKKQKSEYMEALIGALYVYDHADCSDWLCKQIILEGEHQRAAKKNSEAYYPSAFLKKYVWVRSPNER